MTWALEKRYKQLLPSPSIKLISRIAHLIVVCPTSLVYNWKEEFAKFNPDFKVLPVDGTPIQRKKLLSEIKQI